MSDPTDNPVRCGLPATVAVEAYRPGESGGTYGKLDASHYTCADPEHVTAAEALVAVAGMTAFRRVSRSRTASRRCGDRFDYTTMTLDSARPAVCGATADEVGGPAGWLCERAPEHYPNEPHRTYAGQVWEETTWRPAVVPPFDPRGFPPSDEAAKARVLAAAQAMAGTLRLVEAIGYPVSGPARDLMDAVAALDDPPETPAERVDRLAAELEQAFRQAAAAEGRHPDVVGPTDPAAIKALSDAVDAAEEAEHDRVVSQRLLPGQRGGES